MRIEAKVPNQCPEIGGRPVVRLELETAAGTAPEFKSATVLPGLGMNVLQLTAHIPGQGLVDVLSAPSVEEAARILNSQPSDSVGIASTSFGGGFLLPYANRIRGKLTRDRKNITTIWNGKTLVLPAVWRARDRSNAELHAIHGLLLGRKADDLSLSQDLGSQTLTAIIHGSDFDQRWPSKTDVAISITLAHASVSITVQATNVGGETAPMGIGWHPYFNIPSGRRNQARLHIPAAKVAEVNNYLDVFPTGKLNPVKSTKYDFTPFSGRRLEDIFLDDNFSEFDRTDGAIVMTLVDPPSCYGLRIDCISDEIKTVQVYAPPEKSFVAIEPQFNFADPFGDVWHSFDTGMAHLAPGQAVSWKVRLRLFSPEDSLLGTP